jgi:hypothetical protein
MTQLKAALLGIAFGFLSVLVANLEYAMTPNWTVKGMAIYVQLGTASTNWISPGSHRAFHNC